MLRRLNNNDGVVFVTVLAVIITMMVLAVSIIGLNVSQTLVTEREVKRIKAELLAMGALSYTFANQMSDSPGNAITFNQILDGIDYDVSATLTPASSPPASSPDVQALTISIDY